MAEASVDAMTSTLISPAELLQPQTSNYKVWIPERAIFTPAALDFAHGHRIWKRVQSLGIEAEVLKSNRVTDVRGTDARETYNRAKRTLAVVVAPPSAMKLSPIPPSADWQFHLAEGCPAHCQYCYLAGSLSGPPVVRAFANLDEILENTRRFEQADKPQSFEVSCYTDPLGIEHLTGSLETAVRHFASREGARLRWTSKFDAVDSLLGIEHCGNIEPRVSLNADAVSRRFEGGTASVEQRLEALRRLTLPHKNGGGDYPAGIVLAPIMPFENWQGGYASLFDKIEDALAHQPPLTFELITHRFTPGSKDTLLSWYPRTQLEMDETLRAAKRNKFGGTKFVYPREVMSEMRAWFESEIGRRFPHARILYWT